MKNYFTILFVFVVMNGNILAQEGQVFKLWEGNPPTSNHVSEDEVNDNGIIYNVSVPDITVYLPEEDRGYQTAVIICPGGAYAVLASHHEGHDFAKWLSRQGIAGIVLKYRLPNKNKTVPLEDFHQAIRMVRSNAKEWNLNPNKIGVAGFSAGGHLASTASTHFTQDTRPDFSVLFYPVISMGEFTHEGSRENLLGDNYSQADVDFYSNEKQITTDTPPAILLLSDDDTAVVPQNSTLYYNALKANNIPASMYIFPSGGHGWGMNENFRYHTEMTLLLLDWLEVNVVAK